MKAKKRQIPTVEVVKRQVEKSTRQQEHQVTGLVQPPVPKWACWQVLEWSIELGNWQHNGFARDVAERTRLADSIRALSGRVKYHELTPVVSDQAVGGSGSKGPGRAPPSAKEPAKVYPRTPAYRSALRKSLLHWLHVVGTARREVDVPIEQIESLRAACKWAVKQHGEHFASAVLKDPLHPWGE